MSDEEEEEDVIFVPPSPSREESSGGSSNDNLTASTISGLQSSVSQRTLSNFITSQSRLASHSGVTIRTSVTSNQNVGSPSISQRSAGNIAGPPLPILNLDEDARMGYVEEQVLTVGHDQNVQGQDEASDERPSETTGSDVIQVEDSDDSRSSEASRVTGDNDTDSRPSDQSIEEPPQSAVPVNPQTPLLHHPPQGEALLREPAVQLLSDIGDSPADFRSPKRRRIASPQKASNSEAGQTTGEEEEDDSNCCPICFDDWTTSGSHRLSSLKCGHLFGQSCIEKWLKGQGGKCPHCNAKAKRQDIRVLYAKSIKAVDTTERDRALQDLEKERETRRKTEMEAAQLRLQFQMATEENNRLKTELDRVRLQLNAAGRSSTSSALQSSPTKIGAVTNLSGQFSIDRTIKIWEAGNCRVMAYSPSLATLVVSQPSSSPLFPGFGIKKISAMDFKTSQYLTIHSKAIRDVAFHPLVDDGILLSCGLDKTVKMTSVISNAVVQTYETQQGVWSCVWNSDDRNYFYAGQQNGRVLEFDIRNTAEHVQEMNTEGSRSPIVSLQYIPRDIQSTFRSGGLLVGQLDRISFFERKAEDNTRLHMLPLEGNLTSLCFEPLTRHVLVSFRPTARHPTTRHQVCEMVSTNLGVDPSSNDNTCSCHIIHTFHGGRTQSVLSRSAILPHPQDNTRMMVCAGEETTSMIHTWDSGTGQLKQRIHAGGAVVDICSFNVNQQLYLVALTEKHLRVLKWS